MAGSLLAAMTAVAYAGQKPGGALREIGRRRLETIKRPDAAAGFALPPRRWVVERSFARLRRNRRLAKDFEASIARASL